MEVKNYKVHCWGQRDYTGGKAFTLHAADPGIPYPWHPTWFPSPARSKDWTPLGVPQKQKSGGGLSLFFFFKEAGSFVKYLQVWGYTVCSVSSITVEFSSKVIQCMVSCDLIVQVCVADFYNRLKGDTSAPTETKASYDRSEKPPLTVLLITEPQSIK